jgi:hypothetical protein
LVSASQDVHIDQIATVLDSVQVGGVEWIRVQYGSDRSGDFVEHGWAPAQADIDRGGGIHVDPVYEYVVPDCPDGAPTLGGLGGLTPLHALYCFGSETLTFAPVQVRREGEEDSELVDGQPAWLAEGGGLVAYWFPERLEMGSIRVHVDPSSGIELTPERWIEVSGHLDDPASSGCSVTSVYPEFQVANRDEAVQLCRGRFVVTGARLLSEAEIPAPLARPTPGPQPGATLNVAVREFDGPFSTRISPSAVWTGTEMIVWGGSDWTEDWNSSAHREGAAYSPSDRSWRRIPDGPLSPRAGAAAAWTGTEMLVWGGHNDRGPNLTDGAAYDPGTDRWRTISPAPLRSSYDLASVWTGTEWWVAAGLRNGVDVAAYDPAADNWRTLPSTRPANRNVQLFWTGTEVLLTDTDGGLFSIEPNDEEWQSEPVDFLGPTSWTGELLVGVRVGQLGPGPFQSESWFFPVGWNPETQSEVDLPKPPGRVFDPIWTGDHLVFFDYGLALDLDAGEWLAVHLEREPAKYGYREGAATVWAGDRLIVWGGWSACPGYVPGYDTGYELIPQENTGATPGSGEGGGLAPSTTGIPSRFFAC